MSAWDHLRQLAGVGLLVGTLAWCDAVCGAAELLTPAGRDLVAATEHDEDGVVLRLCNASVIGGEPLGDSDLAWCDVVSWSYLGRRGQLSAAQGRDLVSRIWGRADLNPAMEAVLLRRSHRLLVESRSVALPVLILWMSRLPGGSRVRQELAVEAAWRGVELASGVELGSRLENLLRQIGPGNLMAPILEQWRQHQLTLDTALNQADWRSAAGLVTALEDSEPTRDLFWKYRYIAPMIRALADGSLAPLHIRDQELTQLFPQLHALSLSPRWSQRAFEDVWQRASTRVPGPAQSRATQLGRVAADAERLHQRFETSVANVWDSLDVACTSRVLSQRDHTVELAEGRVRAVAQALFDLVAKAVAGGLEMLTVASRQPLLDQYRQLHAWKERQPRQLQWIEERELPSMWRGVCQRIANLASRAAQVRAASSRVRSGRQAVQGADLSQRWAVDSLSQLRTLGEHVFAYLGGAETASRRAALYQAEFSLARNWLVQLLGHPGSASSAYRSVAAHLRRRLAQIDSEFSQANEALQLALAAAHQHRSRAQTSWVEHVHQLASLTERHRKVYQQVQADLGTGLQGLAANLQVRLRAYRERLATWQLDLRWLSGAAQPRHGTQVVFDALREEL